MAAGALASVGTGLVKSLLYGEQVDVGFIILTAGYLIGDISGLFFLMLALITLKKFMHKRTVT